MSFLFHFPILSSLLLWYLCRFFLQRLWSFENDRWWIGSKGSKPRMGWDAGRCWALVPNLRSSVAMDDLVLYCITKNWCRVWSKCYAWWYDDFVQLLIFGPTISVRMISDISNFSFLPFVEMRLIIPCYTSALHREWMEWLTWTHSLNALNSFSHIPFWTSWYDFPIHCPYASDCLSACNLHTSAFWPRYCLHLKP